MSTTRVESPPPAGVTEIDVQSRGTRLSAWHFPATSDAWTTPAGRPCVVMAPGLGGTKDSGLAVFAERFAAAGADVVAFDYRGFGTSDGEPRQHVDHRRQREDYRSVVAAVRGMDGLDPDRVVLWGTSYSGGHVVAVAAGDPRVAAVISQGAAMDGRAAVLNVARTGGARDLLRVTSRGVVGQLRRLATVPVVGEPGSVAAIATPGSLEGYSRLFGPTFRNEMLARDIPLISLNRPVTAASKVRVPLMLVIAERDDVTPVASVEEVARRAKGRVRVERLDCGHFDIYVGADLERSLAAQVDFLSSVLGERWG